VDTSVLPTPTEDRDQLLDDFAEHGYCLVANALSPAEVRAARSRLIEAALEDVDAGRAYIDGGGANQRLWTLLNRGSIFAAIAEHPVAIDLMDAILGEPKDPWWPGDDLPGYLLGSIAANIAGPGGEAMHLHQDQFYVPFPWPPFPLVTNIAWMLDDTTAANGATRVVPGSHRFDARPDGRAEGHVVAAEGAAGTALVFDGRLWHGTGANTTVDEKRHVVLAYYSKPWLRSQENHIVSTDPAVVEHASPTLRRLLGFDPYASLGMINGIRPTHLGLPELAPAPHHQRG
jgi:ectoine hydroxylase-related dioxygenase (phytanoyl-CoA dioxygenase family)